MTKHGKGKDKLSEPDAANIGDVMRDAQETFGLIKQAAAKGKSGKKQDHAALLGALAKTTKGVVELAIDQRKKYVAKKQETADLRDLSRRSFDGRSAVSGGSVRDALTFRARYQNRKEPQIVSIDTGAPYTVIDQRSVEALAAGARVDKLDRPLELYVDGMTVKTTARVFFDLDIAGETADIRLPCTAYIVDRFRAPRLLLGTDMLTFYGIDLLISRMYMRVGACERELVPLSGGR
jgi:hypothetical protein